MTVDKLLPGRPADRPNTDRWQAPMEGRIVRQVADETQAAHFTLRDFDDEAHEWGPAPWMPRVQRCTEPDGMLVCCILLPAPGDRCLVAFTGEDGHDPWIIAYWPTGYEDTRV